MRKKRWNEARGMKKKILQRAIKNRNIHSLIFNSHSYYDFIVFSVYCILYYIIAKLQLNYDSQ